MCGHSWWNTWTVWLRMGTAPIVGVLMRTRPRQNVKKCRVQGLKKTSLKPCNACMKQSSTSGPMRTLGVGDLSRGEFTLLPDDEIRQLVPGKSGAQLWSEMEDGARGRRSKLLSNRTGVTVYNHGLNCAMLDVLGPYQTLMCRLQTQSHPIAYRVCKWFHEFFDNTNMNFLGPDPLYGPHLNDWFHSTDNVVLKKQVQ